MKITKLVILAGLLGCSAAFANDVETAYVRLDELRASNASDVENAYGAFEYISLISRAEAKPASISGCLMSLKNGVGPSDPCMPVSARVGSGGTGGVD